MIISKYWHLTICSFSTLLMCMGLLYPSLVTSTQWDTDLLLCFLPSIELSICKKVLLPCDIFLSLRHFGEINSKKVFNGQMVVKRNAPTHFYPGQLAWGEFQKRSVCLPGFCICLWILLQIFFLGFVPLSFYYNNYTWTLTFLITGQ